MCFRRLRTVNVAAAVLSASHQNLRSQDYQPLLDLEPETLPPITFDATQRRSGFPDRAVRVLLLDANTTSREAVAALVRDVLDGNCSVDCASDVRLGLDLIAQDVHDLCLVGLGRPVEDALILIRAAAECRGAVVALADSSDEELSLLVLGAGAADCIARPDLSRTVLGRSFRQAIVRQHKSRLDIRLCMLLDREKDRLNALQDVSHLLALRCCHDIRSPLTVIKTYSSILLSELAENIDVEQARFFRAIMRRADDAASMLDDVLDASQLASDLVGSHREATSLEALVEELRPGLEQQAAASEVQLTLSMDGSLPSVFCDRGNIGHVIHGLVRRACKAAGEGAAVELWARSEPEGKSVRIGVTDNRPDAAKGDQLVFEPGYQPPSGNAGNGDEGLGAHVLSELVRINLGVLSVTAHPGGGSTSAFTVPLIDLDRILSVHLGVLESGRQTVSALSVVLAMIAPSCSDRHSKEIVEFLWGELRACDLVVPVRPGVWALCISCNASEIANIVQRIARALEDGGQQRLADPLPAPSLRILGSWPLSAPSAEIALAVRRAPAANLDLHRDAGPSAENLNATPLSGAAAEPACPPYREGRL